LKVKAESFCRLKISVVDDKSTERWLAPDKTLIFVISRDQRTMVLECDLEQTGQLFVRKGYGDYTVLVEQDNANHSYALWYNLRPGPAKIHVTKSEVYA
jgi:hypothetical protein